MIKITKKQSKIHFADWQIQADGIDTPFHIYTVEGRYREPRQVHLIRVLDECEDHIAIFKSVNGLVGFVSDLVNFKAAQ